MTPKEAVKTIRIEFKGDEVAAKALHQRFWLWLMDSIPRSIERPPYSLGADELCFYTDLEAYYADHAKPWEYRI